MIIVENLRKTFSDLRRGEVDALSGITFKCLPGRIFGLLGLNGAGKSTTMRILSTVLRPTGGAAQVVGFDVVQHAPLVRQNIGFLSNSTALYDRMSAREHVAYFGRLYGLSETLLADRLQQVFHWLQMRDFENTLVAKMSTGMRQKVSIARALIHDPPVLIFDEPTNGLDVMVSRALLEKILELKEQGKCIIYSTHHMREVEKICDDVAIIHQGRLLAKGTLDELRQAHGEQDVEELFFRLIEGNAQNDGRARSPTPELTAS